MACRHYSPQLRRRIRNQWVSRANGSLSPRRPPPGQDLQAIPHLDCAIAHASRHGTRLLFLSWQIPSAGRPTSLRYFPTSPPTVLRPLTISARRSRLQKICCSQRASSLAVVFAVSLIPLFKTLSLR